MTWQLWHHWAAGDAALLLAAVRDSFTYPPGDDRATGTLYAPADGHEWPAGWEWLGPGLLAGIEVLLDVRFPIVIFQAYRDGAGCGWHADTPFGAQAILSLGVTRTFGIRPVAGGEPRWLPVEAGDLLFMPDGFQAEWEHCVPAEAVPGERCSLVFRTRGP